MRWGGAPGPAAPSLWAGKFEIVGSSGAGEGRAGWGAAGRRPDLKRQREVLCPRAHAHPCPEAVLLSPSGQRLSGCSSLTLQALPRQGRAGAQPGSPGMQQVGVNSAFLFSSSHGRRAHLSLPQLCGHGWGISALGSPPSLQPQRAGSSLAAGRDPASALRWGLCGRS